MRPLALYLDTHIQYFIYMGLRGPKPKRKEVNWSPELAYAVVLITSDGSLSSDGRHIAFVSKDLQQIENIKYCLGVTAVASHKASGIKGNPNLYYRLQWGDRTLYDFLIGIGLSPNKSLTIGPLKIPDDLFFDFLRGSFDGDGCFYSYHDDRWKNSFMFYMEFISASFYHLDWIRNTLKDQLGIKGHLTSSKRSSLYQLKYAKSESLLLIPALYKNSNNLFLERKRLKIEAAMRIVGKSFLEI